MKKILATLPRYVRKCYSIKKLFLFILILGDIQNIYATDYYFSSVSGDDNRTSIEAQNPGTPWKSINKLNAFASNLRGNDRVLFKSGESFYGTIKIAKSGVGGAPIVFTSFGSGNKPLITSQIQITNLSPIGNGIYQVDLSAYNLARVQIVLLNNQIQEIGRFPNTGESNGGYLKIASVQSNNSFNSQSGNPYSGLGGEVVIRKNNWIIDRHKISNISGSSISFHDNESHYPPQAGFGYFLENHISLLDLPGEWAYDPSNKKFSINLTGYDVSSVNISISTLDNLVVNNPYTTNIKFSNLHFKGSNGSLLNISRSENITIENSTFEFAGENAIDISDVKGLVIQNNQILSSLNNGINIKYGAPGAIIKNNTIDKSMVFQGMAKSSDLAGIGIYLASDSDNSLIQLNRITSVGFNAIHFGGNYTKVLNNYIDNFCKFKQDGGGIYTNSDGFRDRNNTGREISGNIVLNGKGTKNGTMEEVNMAEGIYIDDNSSGVKISENTVAFMSGKGIFLHNSFNIQILNNLFYRSHSQIQMTHDFIGDPIRNITVNGNIFSSVEKLDNIFTVYSVLDDIGSLGSIDSNYFLDPFGIDFFIHTKSSADPALGIKRNLGSWKNSFGYDVNSIKPVFDLSTTKIVSSNLIKESSFSEGSSIIDGVYNASSKVATSGISGHTFVINPNNSNSATAYIQIGNVSKGEKIMLEFDLIGTPEDKAIELFLEGTFNIDNGEGNKIVSTKSSVTHYAEILESKASNSNESIVFRIPSTANEIYLDNIKISKVQTEEIPKEDFIFFDYNYSGTAIQKSLDGTYMDAKNQQFVGSVTIPAYGSVLLAKVSSEGSELTNQAPTVQLIKPVQKEEFIWGINKVQLEAIALDPEGEIKNVEFYNWGTLVKTVTVAPYVFEWPNAEIGDYQVYAKVTDVGNLTAVSETINFSVKPEKISYSPQMIDPINNSVFILNKDPVVLKTNATSSGLTITKVEYFNWGYSVITVTEAPFEYAWNRIHADNFKVYALVTDNAGNVYKTNETNFEVQAVENTIPTVDMVTPYNGQSFILGTDLVTLKAQVSDPTKVKKLQFYNWGFPMVEANSYPFSFDWTKIEVGDYKIYAEVTDINGAIAKSETITFSVTPSTSIVKTVNVSISQPYEGQHFILGRDLVTLKANSNFTASKVEFYNWGFPLVEAPVSTMQYDWTKIEQGEYLVYAIVTDSNGVEHKSGTIRFWVKSNSAARTTEKEIIDLKSSSIPVEKEIDLNKQLEIIDDSSVYGIKMGPNPTSGILNLYFEDYPQNLDGIVRVVDIRGIELISAKFNTNDGNIRLDLTSIPIGIYIVMLDFGNKGIQTKKLIRN